MQKVDQFDLKINVIPNGLEKFMYFDINNKLIFTESFQFLSSSWDILLSYLLVNNFGKDDFQYLTQ